MEIASLVTIGLVGLGAVVVAARRGPRALFGGGRAGGAPDDRPVLTAADMDRIEAELERLRRPIGRLVPGEGPSAPAGTRLGGAPWSPFATDRWPLDREGRPMLFLAQVNFAEAAGLDGLPEAGLLQLFVPVDRRGGLAAGQGDGAEAREVRWFHEPRGGTRLRVPEGLSRSPLRGAARQDGVALRVEADRLPPMDSVPAMEALSREVVRGRAADAGVEARINRWWEGQDEIEDRHGAHWIGGHPGFAQDDPRGGAVPADLDRVLLHLGADEHLELGEGAQLNLLIRDSDLARRRLDRAWLAWDRG